MGLAVLAMWFCGLSSVTSASRMVYAFARDGGVPFASHLRKVSARWRTPHVATVVCVALPFFAVATSAPLLQKWFAATDHPAARDPYFLYAASNLGSMLALLAYPVIVEPYFGLGISASFNLATQSWLWAVGYILLGVAGFLILVGNLLITRMTQLES